jgi:group I intron endonuclease
MTRLQLFFLTIELLMGNLHLAEIQKITKEELKGKSGIYGFLCKTTNKLYVGSSIELSSRYYEHINSTRSNVLLQNAINKYKLQDFILIVFEYCEPKDLINKEQNYLDILKPQYNILQIAGSSLGYKHTKESLVKMSITHQGYTHSVESKAKISYAMSGNKHPMFGKTGEKNPASKKVYIYLFDLKIKKIILQKSFNTCIDAALYFSCSTRTLSRYLDKNILYKKQWIISTSLKTNK